MEIITVFSARLYGKRSHKINENYGDPDGDYTEPTENMISVAIALVDIIKREYPVFLCEPTGEKLAFSKEEVFDIIG